MGHQKSILVPMRLLNRLVGRPSIIKATFCSFFLHVGTVSAMYLCWSEPMSRFSVSGQRNAIRIDATFSESRSLVADMRIEAGPPRPTPLTEIQPCARARTEAEISPAKLQLARREFTFDSARSTEGEMSGGSVEFNATVARSESVAQPTSDLAKSHSDLSASFPHLPRTARPRPPQLVAVAQAAGVDATTPPDFAGNRPPAYPLEAIRRRLEGMVVLRLHISKVGDVEHVEISESSGHSILDGVALEAVRQWQGEPAQRAGHAIATVELLPIVFRLRD
jgi:TonB family protein